MSFGMEVSKSRHVVIWQALYDVDRVHLALKHHHIRLLLAGASRKVKV